ncbi:myomegalin isoform X2 [Varanus komodoensis]|uniref:myomegalin isoform X2 n=1 Tax=Varanus komodoensis TaxID=61221 RepID=UPI001CF77325|nr:myomegalin isoform X2 [Varanus komodoensis]
MVPRTGPPTTVPAQPVAPGDLGTGPVESHAPGGLEQSSATQMQTLRDFEQHLSDLKKENFSLKLRIYFLEDRMQQKYEASREDVYRRNIELKVEVESLKQELREKQQALEKAWSSAENPGRQNEAESSHERRDAGACAALEKKALLLQEEAQSAKVAAEKMGTLAEAEKERCKELQKQLVEFSKKEDEARKEQARLETCSVALAEKDMRIQELTRSLRDKQRRLDQLSTEKQHLLRCLDEARRAKAQNLRDDLQQDAQCDLSVRKRAAELSAMELLEKVRGTEATNKQLQEKLSEMESELRSARHTSQKQDLKLQNLNESLKSKEKESEELNRVIEGQNETIANLQDKLHKSQLRQVQGAEGSAPLHQGELLEAQHALFCAQLEAQQLKRLRQQKERQLAESTRGAQFLEAVLQEEQRQKEAAWHHNKELRAALQQLKAELQSKDWQSRALEREKWAEAQRHERVLRHWSQRLARTEQLLRESNELLQQHQSAEERPALAAKMVQTLQQRVSDRDAALERAVDEKFRLLEDREQELQQLHRAVQERERDLEGLRAVLASNQATIQGLEDLLKARGLELQQLQATCQNWKWLREELEAHARRGQARQEHLAQQLWAALCDGHQEATGLSAMLLPRPGPGQEAAVEELCLRLQQRERVVRELLANKSWQATEHTTELQELLQAASAREQQSNIFSAKLTQALIERTCELQVLRQQLVDQASRQKTEAPAARPGQKHEAVEAPKQGRPAEHVAARVPAQGARRSAAEEGVLGKTAELEKELLSSREELRLLAQKERESRLELSALRSEVAAQEQELQVQASDIASLSRSIQIKEGLIKLLLSLEGLAAERERLNEALEAERQLYRRLGTRGAPPGSSPQDQTLHLELEAVQGLRGQLEEALARTAEHLSRLESLEGAGGLSMAGDEDGDGDGDEDAGTEFSDSIEEAAAQRGAPRLQGAEAADAPGAGRESSLRVELLCAKAALQRVGEQKATLEGELQAIKGQVQEAGFASVAQLRKALLSLCLENAELKEQVGEATSSEGWENDEEKDEAEDRSLEVQKLQEKLRASEVVIGLLQGQLALSGPGGDGLVGPRQPQGGQRCPGQGHPRDSAPPPRQAGGSPSHSPAAAQADPLGGGGGCAGGAWERCQKLRGQLPGTETPSPALRREAEAQWVSKQIQVDLQDLGYETCGRSENEAEREEATSPECDAREVEAGNWKRLLGFAPCRHADWDCSRCGDAALLRQHVQALQAQLRHSRGIIQALRGHVCSGPEALLPLKRAGALGSSPCQSVTDEDEGWHSDSLGSVGATDKDLAGLIRRVSQLEAHLAEAKPKLLRPEALPPAASLGKYDSLVQAQARELSHLRQVMREGQGACRLLSQCFRDAVKSFEELLRGNDIDCFLGQSFREQLAQGSRLAGRLARKLSAREPPGDGPSARNESPTEGKADQEGLVRRLSQELRGKAPSAQQPPAEGALSTTPCSSPTASESPRAGSSASFASGGLESCSDVDDASEPLCPADPGDRWLRRFLDRDPGSPSDDAPAALPLPTLAAPSPAAAPADAPRGSCAQPPPQHPLRITCPPAGGFHPGLPSLPAGFSRAPLDSGLCSPRPSGPPLPALDPLLGGCRTPFFALAEAQQELQVLQKQLGEGSDLLEEHLSEMRILHQRLQETIHTNDRLREQMEARLAAGARSGELEHLQKPLPGPPEMRRGEVEPGQGRAAQPQPQPQRGGQDEPRAGLAPLQEAFWALQANNSRLQHRVMLLQQECMENRLLFKALEAELRVHKGLSGRQQQADSGASAQENLELADDGHRWGALVTGRLEDYSNLQRQILEGKTLTHKMASLLQPCLEPQGSQVFCHERLAELLASTCALHRILETAASLLAAFWRGALPTSREMQLLKAKVVEQENRLHSASQVQKSMESFLLAHLTRTHDVLRRARTNLEGVSQQPAIVSSIV